MKQENDILGKAGVSHCQVGYAKVQVLTSGDAVWAYASVVDNQSGDPTAVPVIVE